MFADIYQMSGIVFCLQEKNKLLVIHMKASYSSFEK